MARSTAARRIVIGVLTLVLLLASSPVTMLATRTVARAETSQPDPHPSTVTQPTAPDVLHDAIDLPSPSGPSLALTWSSETATVGIPLTLTIQALDAEGQPDPRNGQIMLDIPDPRALLDGQPGEPTSIGQRYVLPLQNGAAHATMQFATPGSYDLLATRTDDLETAGQAATLVVEDVTVTIEGPTTVGHATPAAYSVSVRDPEGQLVRDYQGTLVIQSDDPTALLSHPPSDGQGSAALVHTFSSTNAGELRFTAAFGQPGERTLTVSDPSNPDRQASQSLTVAEPADDTGTAPDQPFSRLAWSDAPRALSTPYFDVAISATSTHAGVPLTLTATARNADGTVNTGYRGRVAFTATDPAFGPGTTYRYTFTAVDNGVHAFPVTFATAGAAQSITITDTANSGMTGTSPDVAVAETYLHATFGVSSVVQGVSVNLTVEAKDSLGNLVTGYRGTVELSASWNSVTLYNWGSGVTYQSAYAFTATDAGSHTFTPKFTIAGQQTATITDRALASRTVTTSAITVTNSPATNFPHASTPTGVKLADGSYLYAFLGIRGRIYTRKNIGTFEDPIWTPTQLVRDITGFVGADTPSLVQFGSTLALLHSYTDGTYYQVWLMTSTDAGATWSTPTKLTSEAGHVGRIQTVVDGSTLYLFWSRQDTERQLFYRTTTDLANWSATQTVGQAIGVPVGTTTTNFGITKTAAGAWVLGWLWPSAVNEISGVAGNFSYPTVQVATSTDLASWSSAVELNLPYSQRGSRSVAIAQNPDDGLLHAVTEQAQQPWDTYLVSRTSSDGVTWSSPTLVGVDASVPANGRQGYIGKLPALVVGSIDAIGHNEVGGGDAQGYGHGSWENADSCAGVSTGAGFTTCSNEGLPPYPDCASTSCNETNYPVNTLTGYQWTAATDLAVPARGLPLVVARTYHSYNGVHGLDSAFGIGWNWTYGTRAVTLADGSVAIVEANGTRSLFWADGSGWTAGPNVWDTLSAGSGGGYVLTRHAGDVWTFNADGTLASIADRNGNTQILTYTSGVLTGVTAAGGRSLAITTDTNGHITRIDAPGGLFTTYTYDTAGHLLTATDPAGAVMTYTYDTRHQMLTVVDANNHTVESNTWGSLGRIKQQRDADNQLTTFSYAFQTIAGSLGASQTVDPLGNLTYYYNDAAMRLTQRITYHKVGSSQAELERLYFTYDAQGNTLTRQVGFLGPVTSYTYDSRGNRLSETINSGTGGLNLTTTFTYNASNDLLTVTDPRNQTTTLTYDTAGNLLTVTNPLNQTTTFGYNTNGELTSVTNALSEVTTFGYSTAGDLTTITEPGSIVTTLGYDGAGRLTTTTDPLNHTTTLTVNGRGQVTSVTNALSQTTSYGYDDIGNLTTVTDPLSRTTTYDYDELNRLTSVTDALNGVTSYGYDANSNLTLVTDANGNETTWTADALGRVLTAKDDLLQTTTYTYDNRSNLTHVLDANGVTNRYVYDAANRLTGIDLTYTSGTPVPDISYGYDAASRRTTMADGTGTTTYTYDNANQLLSVTAPVTGTVTYTYDALGRRASLLYPGQTTPVTYAYTARGQLDTVTDWLSNVTDYGYDAAGRLTSIDYPNGVDGTLGYDDADRLTSLDYVNGGTTLEAIAYTLNAAGIRTQMIDATGTTVWGYDALYRLTSVDYPSGDDISYTYDAVGNRETLTVGTVTSDYSYNTLNQLTAIDETDDGTDDTTYGYDANGNQTSKAHNSITISYGWDALNRLTSVASGGSTVASYAYNGDGLRTRKIVGATTDFTWDQTGLGTVIQIADGTIADDYLWGLGLLGRIDGSGAETYVHGDGLGSVRAISDSIGADVGSVEYDAFGTTRTSTGVQYAFGFTGEQVDAETGFVYLRARYMDPGTGRFVSRDPYPGTIDQPATTHRYTYVRNAPTIRTDPSGLTDALDPGQMDGYGPSGGSGGPYWRISPTPNGGGSSRPLPTAPQYGPPAPPRGPDFVVYPSGTAISTSRSMLEAGFNRAGFVCGPTRSPGMQYTDPATGNIYRVMNNPPRLTTHAPGGNPIMPDGSGVGHLKGSASRGAWHFPLEP